MQSQPFESKDIRPAEFEKFYAEILASSVDPSIKTDVHNNVQCWVYIAHHFDFIKDAVDDWIKYPAGEKSKAADKYYPYAKDIKRDKKNGLLRTPEQLSFHIQDYKDGAVAVSSLNNHLDQIASVLKQLSAEDRIIFGAQFEWNKQVPCMEARSERPLGWAFRKLSGMTPLLKDVMTEIGILYNISSKEKLFIDFAEEYCRRRGYAECFDDEQQLKNISKQLLHQQGVLACFINEEEKVEQPSVLAAAYKTHTQSATAIELGFTGTMIKHHFADKNDAKKFLAWAKEQKQLPKINKASIEEERDKGKVSYVVRLSTDQLEIIDKERLNRLRNPSQFAVTAAPVPKAVSPTLIPDVKRAPALVIQSVQNSQRSDTEIERLCRALLTTVYQDDAKEITKLMTGVSEEEQVRLLERTDKIDASNLLQLAAYTGKNSFKILFDLFSTDVRNRALISKSQHGSPVFSVAAQYQSSDTFCHLVKKTDEKILNLMLPLRNEKGSTVLHLAANYQLGIPFRTLVEKANAKDISQALSLQNDAKDTALFFAAEQQPDDVFYLLVEKVDAKAIDQILPLQNKHGNTALHSAAIFQRGAAFHLLIEKADAKVISQVLALQSIIDKETVLHLAAWQQPGDAFRRLIEKADTKSIDQALSLQNETEETVLHVAASYQPSDAFAHLIKRCSPEALSKACCLYKKGQSVLESALSYQSPSVIAELLNKIDDNALKAMLKAPNIPSRLLAAMAGCLGHEPSFQTQPLVGRLFALAGPQLADYCAKLWLAGKSLPHTVVQAALPHFERLIQTQPQRASELEAIAGIFSKEEKSERKEEAIQLKSGEVLELKDEEKAQEILWKQGLQSLYDYHLLKKHFPGSPIAQTADDLYRAGLLFKGCGLPFETPVINQKLSEANAKGEVLLKIIKPKDWPEFKRQIGDYNYRADLRDEKQDKSKAQDKYVHAKGKTLSEMGEEYKDHTERKKDHPYKHTIKQSLSLLSKNYDTAVFGEHDPDRPLVGLLFSKEHSIIKAMLLKDLGTFGRKWVGSKEEVAKYAKEMEKINVTDFKTFKEEIEKNPQRLNEVLAKLSREAMLGVVFVTDTPEARKQARDYHADIKANHKINLPIYFYDRALRAMRIYTPREQQDDIYAEQNGLPGYNSICEGERKLRLIQKLSSNIPDDGNGFIELLQLYKVIEENKPKEAKNLWHRLWQFGVISREANQLAAQKMIDLLNKEELQAPITEQDFDALKTGDLGKIMNAMRGKNILPDEFLKRERDYVIKMRKS